MTRCVPTAPVGASSASHGGTEGENLLLQLKAEGVLDQDEARTDFDVV